MINVPQHLLPTQFSRCDICGIEVKGNNAIINLCENCVLKVSKKELLERLKRILIYYNLPESKLDGLVTYHMYHINKIKIKEALETSKKPERDDIINQDDINNLIIDLETSNDLEEFLHRV